MDLYIEINPGKNPCKNAAWWSKKFSYRR